jgi:hypothetical protein
VSTRTARASRRPAAGEILLRERSLRAVELDVRRARARLRCADVTLTLEGIRATTLLGPWDGATGTVEHVKVVAVAAGAICVEVRVRYVTVPRVYRVVCRAATVRRR